MEIEIQLTNEPVAETISPPQFGLAGAWVEFRGIVRGEENGASISALEYEAYPEMAAREMRRLLQEISLKNPCLAVKVIHRLGTIPVGDTALYVGVAGRHRGETIRLLVEFIDRLKQDVPVWKRQALPIDEKAGIMTAVPGKIAIAATLSLSQAISEIQARCEPLPPMKVALDHAFGRVLHETVCATEDLPDFDRSTRDGFAILKGDESESFQIVDTIHAADWKPRDLKTGQAVRVATGAPLPCGDLRVVMQENVERHDGQIRIVKHESALNLRRRGEDVKAGAPLVKAGARLDAGKMSLLATVGCVQPLVSPRLRVCHFTTGDELVPPNQKPNPGQIRDSNSLLIRGLLQKSSCDLAQGHLPESFELAKLEVEKQRSKIAGADVLFVSGGASVGEKDFTRALLEWLGFETVFSQVNVRPGRPLIFGTSGKRIAFGLPGNPLSHFVCFHLFVASALARLAGVEAPNFLRGRLADTLADAPCPRETLWPARLQFLNGELKLHPLKWSSSGDVTCFAEANALIRVPANQGSMDKDATVNFLLTSDRMEVE